MNNFLITILNCGRKPYKHKCSLAEQPHVSSYFFKKNQYIRRGFRELFLLSSNIKLRRCYIKSFKAIEQDRALHLTEHFYMIHPYSDFRFYWELFIIISIFGGLLFLPMVLMSNLKNVLWHLELGLIFQFIIAVDIILNFFTGYVGPENSIILSPQSIAKRYFKSFFLPDFISVIPFGIIIFKLSKKVVANDGIECRLAALMKFLMLFKFMVYSNRFRQKIQISMFTIRFIQCIVILILGVQLFAGLICVAMHLDQNAIMIGGQYKMFINAAVLTVFGTAKTRFVHFGYEIIVRFLLVIFSFVVVNTIKAQIILMCKPYYASNRKFKCILRELEEFCRYKDLPTHLERSVLNHYQFKYNGNYYNEKPLCGMISDNIQSQLNNHTYQVLLSAHVFKNCSRHLIPSFFAYLKVDTYLENDTIFLAGSIADSVMFLNSGTLAIFTTNMSEIAHIEEGSTLCEYALIITKKLTNKYSVFAVERSEILSLHKDDFRKIIVHHPEQYELIIEAIEEKLKKDTEINTRLSD